MLDETIKKALTHANHCLNSLGPAGLWPKEKNQFGETCLRGDWECEEAIINCFKKENLAAKIISEEHGTVDLSPSPFYTIILDGIDGTFQYKNNRTKGIYGTLLGIFHGLDPCYDDYAGGGVMLHPQNTLIIYQKDKGVDIYREMTVHEHISTPPLIVSSLAELVSRQRPIFVDEPWEVNQKVFSAPLKKQGFTVQNLMSSTAYYTAIALGNADLALECTRKKNLELAVFYGLVNELQGVVATIDGQPLGPEKYNEFGQNEHIPVITCTNKSLFDELSYMLTNPH